MLTKIMVMLFAFGFVLDGAYAACTSKWFFYFMLLYLIESEFKETYLKPQFVMQVLSKLVKLTQVLWEIY